MSSSKRILVAILIFSISFTLLLPLVMPYITAVADRQFPHGTVLDVIVSTGSIRPYFSYWKQFVARPDALKLAGIYYAVMGAITALLAMETTWKHPERNVKSGVLGDVSILSSPSALRAKNDFWNGRWTPKRAGLVLGADRGGYYYDSSVPHALVVGKTGSGKSQFMVLETLHLLMAAAWNIIATGKSELVELTGDTALSLGYQRFIFDLNGYPGAGRFNPIELVAHYHKVGQRSLAVQTARQVAADFIPVPGGTNDFFPKAARSLLTAVILIVAMADIPDEEKNMASVCAIINRGTTGEGPDPSAPLKAYIRSLGEGHPAFACASEFLSDGGVTVAGKNTLSTLKDALSIFSDDAVVRVASGSDISMYDLIEKKTIVYIHLLEEDHPYQVLFTVFLNQYWRVANEISGRRGGRLPHETAIVGDELGNCNKLACLPEIITLGRSMRFHVYAFVQNLGQLRRYNKPGDRDAGMNKLLGSMDIKVALSLAALEDCKYFTKLVGKRTVRTQGTSNSTQGSYGSSTSGISYNETADSVIHEWEWQSRIPSRDGSIGVKGGENARPGREGIFQMPLSYANKTPAGAFFGLGSEKEEFAKRLAFRKRMGEQESETKPAPWWCPVFDEYLPKTSAEEGIAEDEFLAWDEAM